MHETGTSATAQRVAGYRLGFERLAAPFGDAAADLRLARDVAGAAAVDRGARMAAYLKARTAFFDRVVVNGLERGSTQVLVVGAGYDGRSLRYAKPGVRWFEVDRPATQNDKRLRLARLGIDAPQVTFVGFDLRREGLAATLVASGFEPDAGALFLCEGVAVYLEPAAIELLLRELRSLSTVGTRLAASFSLSPGADRGARERFESAVSALGEPALSALTAESAEELLTRSRWRAVDLSERAQRAGFLVAAPEWRAAPTQPTLGRVGSFMESMDRSVDAHDLRKQLESTDGVEIVRLRELDVGVFRVERRNGADRVARVSPAARPVVAVDQDVAMLRLLEDAGYPAERCAGDEPILRLRDRHVLVTECVPGRTVTPSRATFAALGDLLGMLHVLPVEPGAVTGSGGAWHHLVHAGGPREELAAAVSLLEQAEPRVPATELARYRQLREELAGSELADGLPEALVHPDFVPANAIAASDGKLVLVDWTGAGRAPRIWPLVHLLYAAGARAPGNVDLVVAGYTRLVRLDPDERAALSRLMWLRPAMLACWSFGVGRTSAAAALEEVDRVREVARGIAERALAAPSD